jgi:hypothetical protein
MPPTVGHVSESLRQLLLAELSDSTIRVSLESPTASSPPHKRVNLFLYRVAPDPQLSNRDWQPKAGSTAEIVHPPLALNLHYLMTTYAAGDPATGLADAQRILGEAMRIFHENPVVPAAHLLGGLRGGQVKVTHLPLDEEQLTRLWSALQEELQLSASYLVSFVDLEGTRERPIPRRVERSDVRVAARADRPAVLSMAPGRGPAGTTLLFAGEGLAGWRARVRVGGVPALADETLEEADSFEAAVPAELPPGVYLVEVDVASLARFSSTFELTP